MNKAKVILAKPSLPRLRRGSLSQKGESKKVILAIETSCDETAAAVLEYKEANGLPYIRTISSVVKSQTKLHSKMGGVVPEAAARAHVKNILPVVQRALHVSSFMLHDIDYIAITIGPGLIPSLIVGVEFAKGLSYATGKPIIPVNHLLGHLYSPFAQIKNKGLKIKDVFPMISLIVSGGHTILVLMKDVKNYQVLGQTVDDAAGEAFDKVAKLLGLPYPGGPEVAKLAAKGNPTAINFPRPMINSKNYNFSFSGLKTAVLYFVKDKRLRIKDIGPRVDICASFQQAAVDVLVSKTLRASKEFKARSISISGGVSANKKLRDELNLKSKILDLKFFAPSLSLTGDNAEMIGLAAAFMLNNEYKPKNYQQIKPDSNLEL